MPNLSDVQALVYQDDAVTREELQKRLEYESSDSLLIKHLVKGYKGLYEKEVDRLYAR